jgi:tetratricopeptide (TPR) repeat protein
MLAADYREPSLAKEAEGLIASPGRAETVPVWADLAAAAIYLGHGEVGDAATYAGRAGAAPWAGALLARLAILAGNPEAAFEPLQRSLAADPKLAASLAMQGDLARRVRRDVHAARTAYAAALASSRTHPRATFGLAKLALASQIPLNEAIPPLRALINDAPATPATERARAALHLAALELRAGDKAASNAVLDQVEGLDKAGRAWAELAVLIAATDRKGYRAVKGPPPIFVTASDDDPLEAPAVDPTPPPPPPHPKATPKPAAKPAKKAPPPARKPAARKPPPPRAP